MKYLVTGGAGFIGSNIVEELVRRGESVRVLDNMSTGKKSNLEPWLNDIELMEADIRSYDVVNRAVRGVDAVLHQAALPSVPRSIDDPLTSNEVNVTGTLNVLNAAKENGIHRVVLASSSSVYGNNPELPKHEGMTPNPLSPYAVSKLAAEKYGLVFSNLYGMHVIALRYFNVFGPRQDPNSQYSAVIPRFITAMMKGISPVIYGDGTQSRDFTYVANVVDANIRAATVSSEGGIVMNCACHGRISLIDLVEKINNVIGAGIAPHFQAERLGDVKHSFADIALIGKILHFNPRVSFEEGLAGTVAYFRNLQSQKP